MNLQRDIALTLLVLLIPLISAAQSDRVVKGLVYGESGGPIVGATVYAGGADLSVKTDEGKRKGKKKKAVSNVAEIIDLDQDSLDVSEIQGGGSDKE